MSSTPLIVTALLLGWVGSPHCAGMCGAACGAITRSAGADHPWHAQLALHLGRALSYAAGGALVAGSVAVLKAWSDEVAVVRPLWILLQVAVLILGLWLLIRGQQPVWPLTGRGPWQVMRGPCPERSLRSQLVRVAGLGSLWVAWPCGLLHSALWVAALAPSPAQGAVVMLAFAMASAPALYGGAWLLAWAGTSGRGPSAQRAIVRLSGLLLVASTAWTLVQSVQKATGFC